MPKKACRLFLKVTNVRVERLQDINTQDAISEGIEEIHYGAYKNYMSKEYDGFGHPPESFKTLWQSINGIESWEANPFVWVVEFQKCETPKNF